MGRAVESSDVKHLHWHADRMGDDLLDRVVVNTGAAALARGRSGCRAGGSSRSMRLRGVSARTPAPA